MTDIEAVNCAYRTKTDQFLEGPVIEASVHSPRRKISTCTNISERSTVAGNVALLPLDVVDRFCIVVRSDTFGRKQFYCQMSSDLKVTNENVHCQGKMSSYVTNVTLQAQSSLLESNKCKPYNSSAPVSLPLLIDFPVYFQAFELAEKHPEFKVGYFDLKIV